jgi:glutamyl-tRNA reductase
MKLQVVGCSHHGTAIAVREKLALDAGQTGAALERWRQEFSGVEGVLLSTCNRVEIYAATESAGLPSPAQVAGFLARFHGLDAAGIGESLFCLDGREAVQHLFLVTCSLDSMVVGEPQILSQVKLAYQAATERDATGPLLHAAFQAALAVARRVAGETTIHQRRVSIPSVAVADFARQIFERFDNKHTVVVGAGDMAEETLRYLRDEGARQITIVNRHVERAEELALRWGGRAVGWDQLTEALATADLVISTTGAGKPIVSAEHFARIERSRWNRPLFILDLAVPRDFDPAVGARPDVYLYSIDDLRAACERNRRHRDRQLPAAVRIVDQETDRFMAGWRRRAAGPVIQQLKEGWERPKEEELRRLLNKLPELDDRAREEIRRAFDRLVNKLLHPPLESLRDESRHGIPSALLDALAKLFQLKD